MRTFWIYLRMELKRAWKSIPYFLAGATVLILLLGTVAFSAGKLVYQDAAVGRVAIGMVMPEEDRIARQVVGMLESLDSVESICDFVYVSREEGEAGLRSGELYCLMEVPSGFVQDIMNGKNTPVTIIFPGNAGMEAALLKELTDSAAHTLSVSQAGIYAADELCILYGQADSIPQVEQELNRIYLSYSLSREGYFKKETVSAAGDVSWMEYYEISAFVMLLLLLGIPAAELLAPHSAVFRQKLRIMGIGRLKETAVRYGAVNLLLSGAVCAAGILSVTVCGVRMDVYGVSALILTGLSASALILLCYELAGSAAAGVMLLFFSTVIMAFLSGGLIPSVFLPSSLEQAGRWMPVKLMMDALTGLFVEPVPGTRTKLSLLTAGCFLLAAGVGREHE